MFTSTSQQAIASIVARSWEDPDFHESLINNPSKVLSEFGVSAPEGVEIEVLQNTSNKMYFVLPAAVDLAAASDDECESSAAFAHRSVCSKSSSCCCAFTSAVGE